MTVVLETEHEIEMSKFIEVPAKEICTTSEKNWSRHCEIKQVPFITIRTRRNVAEIHWDYITYSDDVVYHLNHIGSTIFNKAFEIFNRHANAMSQFVANGNLIWFKTLEVKQARLAATELYDLIVWAVHCAQMASLQPVVQKQ